MLAFLLDVACMRMQFANARPVPNCPISSHANVLLRFSCSQCRHLGIHQEMDERLLGARCVLDVARSMAEPIGETSCEPERQNKI
jgi:hypothetical protein